MGATICVSLFIAPESVPAGPFTIHGDNRGFDSDSDQGASRGFIWVPVDDPDQYFQHMNRSVYLSVGPLEINRSFEASDANQWSVRRLEDGIIEVEYDLVISGPLEWSGTAPHINGTIRFQVDAQGEVGSSFIRDGFPWAEAYYHDGKGNITTVFQDPAVRGNPHDLFSIEPNISWSQQLVRDYETDQHGYPLMSTSPYFFTPRASTMR